MVSEALPLKTRSRVVPSFLSQSLDTMFWTTFVEGLEDSKDRLLALPPSRGQTLSNQVLFDSILEDIRHVIALDPSSPLADSEDEQQSSPNL